MGSRDASGPGFSEPSGSSAPAGPLGAYRDKRDPLATNEPFGPERKLSTGETRAGRFVVHLHAARQTHYDLRLQIGRSLKSFAVPRGPSLDPEQRHLAVLTEDHPLEYWDFEEVIPEGNYGAGPMIVWDIGRVSYLEGSAEQGLEKGKIDFVLHGHKLGGRFGLVRTKRGEGKDWLLLKKRDAFAREGSDIIAESPRSVLSGLLVDELGSKQEIAAAIEARAADLGALRRELDVRTREPMLCAGEGAALDEADRLYELKVDGVRILADRHGRNVSLRYRNGHARTDSYPEIARALETLPGERLVLDGEIVAFDEAGRPRFQRIGPRIQARRPLDVARVAAEVPVVYLVFDLLALGEHDLTVLPVEQRKELLLELVRGKGLVRALDHIPGRGQELFDFCRSERLEGVIAKRRASSYRFGPVRTDDWVKIKCDREDDFVVVGWVAGKGSRAELGALCLASYAGSELHYRGRVGSGFDDRTLKDTKERLLALAVETSPLGEPVPDEAKSAHWVRPELVVRVRYLGLSDDVRLRQPVFLGLRDDIDPQSCQVGPHEESAELAGSAAEGEADASPAAAVQGSRPGLHITNRDKVFWPEEGYTKGDLIDYYAAVAPRLLPFLRDRPVVLVRHPDGIHGKSFFQWNVPAGTPDWMRRLTLRDADDPGREKTVFLVDDLESLVYIANLGCIPLHVLACRAGSREHCDFITFDLDLGEQPFARAIEVALSLHELLSEVGLSAYAKTSGQGGLHVLTPLGPGVPFEAAKLMVELLGRIVTARHSAFATMERRVEPRGGRLYVDTGQTGASRTIVAPYSVRAHPGATVSTPLFWSELSGALDSTRLTIQSVPARIAEIGDPLEGFLEARPDVAAALGKLERWVR